MKLKRFLLLGSFLFLILLAVYYWVGRSARQPSFNGPVIGITQFATHPALDAVREGIAHALQERGYVDGQTAQILFRNANGDPSLTLPIAQEFVRRGVSIIVPIATPSALGAAKSTTTIPIVFSGVTDPVGVGLVRSLQEPGGNVTGVSDQWPFEAQIRSFQAALPSLRRIGLLYKPGDDVAKVGVDSLTRLAPVLNFELITQPVSNATDIYPEAVTLLRGVDAIYTGIDHLVLENLESLLKAGEEAGKPILGGESGAVERGALMALSINMDKFGEISGQMAADVLQGASPSTMPIRVVTEGELLVNRRVAIKFHLNLQELKKKGARFY